MKGCLSRQSVEWIDVAILLAQDMLENIKRCVLDASADADEQTEHNVDLENRRTRGVELELT